MKSDKETERLSRANEWMRKSSVESPHSKGNAENKWKRLGLKLVSKSLGGTKSLVRQGRETLIAADIANRKLHKDKTVNAKESKFLKGKSRDTVKALPLAAVEVGSQVIAPGNILPATKGYVALTMGAEHLASKASKGKIKLDLLPKTRSIPKAYLKKYKTNKVDKFINRKVRAIEATRNKLIDD